MAGLDSNALGYSHDRRPCKPSAGGRKKVTATFNPAAALTFRKPTACTYNPLVYARRPHETYLSKYARRGIEALVVGMNPGR
jgi:hypothetical protein